jgi:hypothetical protein
VDHLRAVLRIFEVNADGEEPNPVFGSSHLNDAAAPIVGGPTDGGTVDVEGGWRDAADAIKFTTTTAIASAMLDYAALLVPGEATRLERTADIGVRWLRKAHPLGSPTFIAQVGDNSDHVGFRDFATDDASENPALSHRTAYGDAGSGPLGGAAAALALASQRPGGDAAEADELLHLAKEWYERGKEVSGAGPALGGFEQPGDPTLGFYSDWQGHMALAAAMLYRATSDDGYLDDAKAYLQAAEANHGVHSQFHVGPLVAADLCGGLGRPPVARSDVRDLASAKLQESFSTSMWVAGLTAFASPNLFYFGWVQGHTANAAVAAAAERAGVVKGGRVLAAGARDYLFGRNPWGASFVVGHGTDGPRAPYHPLALTGDPIQRGRGLVVGGPAVATQFPEFEITPNPGDRFAPFNPTYTADVYGGDKIVYEDQLGNFLNSEVGLAYSAPTVLLLAQLIAD